jgi:ABC-2 type transport system permease protein
MNPTVIKRLILKDWYFNRFILVSLTLGGMIALLVSGFSNGFIRIIAAVMFMAAASIVIFMPSWMVTGERREQTLPFIMSLPISIKDYTMAKIGGTLFLALGLSIVLFVAYVVFATVFEPSLAGSVSSTIATDDPGIAQWARSAGSIPSTVVTFGMLVVMFCVNLGVALVAESEKPTMFITIICNICFWFFWSFFRIASFVLPDLASPTIVWRPEILWILAAEVAAVPLILATTFYLQSRKTDFI